jgi:hypothetical protein
MLIFMTNLQKPAIIGHPDLLVAEYAFIPKVTIICRLKISYFSTFFCRFSNLPGLLLFSVINFFTDRQNKCQSI